MQTDDSIRYFVVHDTDSRRWNMALALLVGTDGAVSFQDYMHFRERGRM